MSRYLSNIISFVMKIGGPQDNVHPVDSALPAPCAVGVGAGHSLPCENVASPTFRGDGLPMGWTFGQRDETCRTLTSVRR